MGIPGFDSPAYGTIGGSLPWGNTSASYAFGASSPQQVGQAYQGAYNNALAMNQSNYNNVLAGYQQALASQSSAANAIRAGYSDLYNKVIGQVQNMYSGREDMINRNFSTGLAKTSQQLIDRGLGNTTIQSSVNQGYEGERAYQQSLLTGQEAGTMAEYMSKLGLAGLSNQQRNLENATGMVDRQLDFMGNVKAGYPEAGLFANLAQQARNAGAKNLGAYGGGSFAGAAGGPKLGYVPGAGSSYGTGAGYDTGGGGGGGNSWMMDQYAGAGGSDGGYGGGYGGTAPGFDQAASNDPFAGAGKGDGGYSGQDYSENYGSGLYDYGSAA